MTSDSKKIGLLIPTWEGSFDEESPRATQVCESAALAEEVGFDSVWLVDHFLSELYADEGQYGVPYPEEMRGVKTGFWECWSLASALAMCTKHVEIGTLVSNTGYRNPALLAQMVNTIEDLSDGRVVLGLGAGDFPTEHEAFGYPYERRVGRFEEALQIICPLLKGDKVSFSGEFYQTVQAELRPKAPRHRGPPILIGLLKGGPRMKRLVAQYADIWNCWLTNDSSVETYRTVHDGIIAACEKHRREPETLAKNACIGVALPGFELTPADGEPLSGSLDEIADGLGSLLEEDLDHLVVYMSPFNEKAIAQLGSVLTKLR